MWPILNPLNNLLEAPLHPQEQEGCSYFLHTYFESILYIS
jgi:hypothetical protein